MSFSCDNEMHQFLAKAVSIIRQSQDADDEELFERLVAAGFSRQLAARLVDFVPMAYCRVLLGRSGARFPTVFELSRPDGTLEVRELISEPVWTTALEFANAEAKSGIAGRDILAIAARSAEFDAANQALNAGHKLADGSFGPTLVLWPENGPSD